PSESTLKDEMTASSHRPMSRDQRELCMQNKTAERAWPLDTENMDWIPTGPGKSFRPLRFAPDGWSALMRLDGLLGGGRQGRCGLRHAPLPGRAPARRAARVEAPVGGDLVQPGANRGASLEPGEALPGGQQRVLEGVLGVLEGSEHPVA